IELDEYTLDHPCFSKTDIEQFRKDLCGEDEGIEWVYPGGKVEKIGFWEYAEFQLGIEKKNFRPDMIGNFTSYSEYLPAQIRGGGGIGDFLPCENGLLQKVLPKGGERFWRNVDLFLALQDYEYFKLCQKIYKYAKKKGIKYGVWGPHWRLVRDAQHDPYIDYVGPHTNPIRLAVTPGCSTYYGGLHMAQGKTYTYYFKQLREHLVLNERWGKGTLISYETMRPYRNPIAFYRDAFSAALTTIALAKPKFFNFEQSATSHIMHKEALSDFSMQFNLALLDAVNQARETNLFAGSIYRSTWLIIPSRYEYALFGPTWQQTFPNTGDMRSELTLAGYIPDIRYSQGGFPISDKYKILTLSGTYYSDKTISLIEEWLQKGKGKTFVANYDYFACSLIGHHLRKAERFTRLGIWKTEVLRKYRIKKIVSVNRNVFPDIPPGRFEVEALLPSENIWGNLPDNAKVLMEGETIEGEKVPLIISIPHGKNRIIYIAFPLKGDTVISPAYRKKPKPSFYVSRQVMLDIFSYLQTRYDFSVPRVEISPNLPMSIVFRAPVLDSKGVITIVAKGDAVYGEEKYWTIDPVNLSFQGTQITSKIKDHSMIIASIDGSMMASIADLKINGTLFVSVSPETLWLISTLGNESYHKCKGLHLWTKKPTTVRLLKPQGWKNKKEIKIYNLNQEKPQQVSYLLKDNYLQFKVRGGEYKILYGKIEENTWNKLCLRARKLHTQSKFDVFSYLKSLNWQRTKVGSYNSFQGLSWYKLNLEIPKGWEGDNLIVELGKHHVYNSILLYFNHKLIAYSDSWHSPWGEIRRYILPANIIKYGAENELIVLVESYHGPGGINKPVKIINPQKKEIIDLTEKDWVYAKM
ncbi:hypothetical protein J7L87_02190, partial [bacterium]|nr:hypothetical protein [bacterium]